MEHRRRPSPVCHRRIPAPLATNHPFVFTSNASRTVASAINEFVIGIIDNIYRQHHHDSLSAASPSFSIIYMVWDPFMLISNRSETVRYDEWEEMYNKVVSETVVTTTVIGFASIAAALYVISVFSKITVSNANQTEMSMVVSSLSKDLLEIIKRTR
ncbi:hypothetical protein L1887_03564 [Cichorium endivia]|nr:hypothetical protein L1887_03564 [Cichorium endivia]